MLSLDFNQNSNMDKMDVYALFKIISVFVLMLFSGVLKENINIQEVERCFNNPFGKILYLFLISFTIFQFKVNRPYEHFTEMLILVGAIYVIIYILEQLFPKN